jgi:serine/threonine-protein kinase RsbW
MDGRVRAPTPQKKLYRQITRPYAELLLRLYLESNPEALCMVRSTMECATELVRFPEPESRAIVRSVDEALANVIRHAYKGRPGKPIELACRRLYGDRNKNELRGLEIVMEDSGTPVDPKKLQGRPLEEIRPGGLGLHFMKQSMDVVEFRRKNGKNLLRMVKYLALPRPEAKQEHEGE